MSDRDELKRAVDGRIAWLEEKITSYYGPELEACRDKLARAHAAPYVHSAAVEQEQARLDRCLAAIGDIRRRQDMLRAGSFQSLAEIDAVADG